MSVCRLTSRCFSPKNYVNSTKFRRRSPVMWHCEWQLQSLKWYIMLLTSGLTHLRIITILFINGVSEKRGLLSLLRDRAEQATSSRRPSLTLPTSSGLGSPVWIQLQHFFFRKKKQKKKTTNNCMSDWFLMCILRSRSSGEANEEEASHQVSRSH